ncbi:hypothetical protein HKI87_02g12520 [Chloropicon roscoffensis]|uniref:Uncharacterized protein n=1 Tax=Chloropicon roscoffensis TaxID=1461544 RepID=A0AAX4P0Z6_9CHLO
MAVDNSPFGTDYKGLSLKKDSEEARMESYQRDKRPIYALSSFPVLDRGRADSRSKERGRPAAQVHREDRPSASHALGRAGGQGKPNGTAARSVLEAELEANNPELFHALQDVKRTLQGHSMKRFQQFQALGMMNHEENSVRATAALRVDLIRRTVGLGAKAELEDQIRSMAEETSLEVQLEQVLGCRDPEDLEAFRVSKEKGSESQYERHRKMKRASQSRTLEIQREAEAVSAALTRALGKYRGAIKEILQEPRARKRANASSKGRSKVHESVSREMGSVDALSREEKQQALVHSANDNMEKAAAILERLKEYTQAIEVAEEDDQAAKARPEAGEVAGKEGEDGASTSGDEDGEREGRAKEDSAPGGAKDDRAGAKSQESRGKQSRRGTPSSKQGQKMVRRASTMSKAKQEQEYEEEVARMREEAKREEDEGRFQRALLLDPVEDDGSRDPSDVLQERFERIWDILEMPLMERMDMVIRYTSEEGLDFLMPALDQYERCAGGLRLHNYLLSPGDQNVAAFEGLEVKPEYLERCRDYVREHAYVLKESFGGTLTMQGSPLGPTLRPSRPNTGPIGHLGI